MSSVPAFIPCDDDLQTPDDVAVSYGYCRSLVRSCATSFYHSMRLIPEPKRSSTYALYSWMRIADDLADADGEVDRKARSLNQFWADTQACLRGSARPPARTGGDGAATAVWSAFCDSCARYQLPQPLLRDFISGQLLDLRKTRYATFDELYEYCFKVASVVGLLCVEVWGYSGGAETRRLAEWRGVAFQLTNIARDVREDARRGRVYVPADLAGGGGLSSEDFLRPGGGSVPAVAAVEAVCRLARTYYDASAGLEDRVDAAGRPCLRAMTRTYRGLLDKICGNPAAVLGERRVRLGRMRKTWIALRAACE